MLFFAWQMPGRWMRTGLLRGPAPLVRPLQADVTWHAVRVGSDANSKNSYGRTVSEETLVVDALASQAEEGRGAQRKAPGSGRARDEPEIPEWGNPPSVTGGHRWLNL